MHEAAAGWEHRQPEAASRELGWDPMGVLGISPQRSSGPRPKVGLR